MGVIRPSISDWFDRVIETKKQDIYSLRRDRVLHDHQQIEEEINAYAIPEIRIIGPEKAAPSEDAKQVIVRIPVERNDFIEELLRREANAVSSWVQLEYDGDALICAIPAPSPGEAKKQVLAIVSKIMEEEVDQRNREIKAGNERMRRELSQTFADKKAEIKKQEEQRNRLSHELS